MHKCTPSKAVASSTGYNDAVVPQDSRMCAAKFLSEINP